MRLFILIIGVSGVGKSTIIQQLTLRDPRLIYVTAYMDRSLRPGEIEKISVTPEVFDRMNEENKFVAVNTHFGHRYGTPRATIENILAENHIPILDMQLRGVSSLAEYNDILRKIYILPPTIATLQQRLKQEKRESRREESERELEFLRRENYRHQAIDEVIVNDILSETIDTILLKIGG